ncbi:MAG: glycosyltransferase family 39 protein [Anaerolineales bacterium]
MEEPSVLDYVIDIITFWKKKTIAIPPAGEEEPPSPTQPPSKEEREERQKKGFFNRVWVILQPLFLALIAQFFLEPPRRAKGIGVALYLLAAAILVVLIQRKSWFLSPVSPSKEQEEKDVLRLIPLFVGVAFSLLAFVFFSENQFTPLNVSLWVIGFLFICSALWVPEGRWNRWASRWRGFRLQGIHLSLWSLLVLLVFGISAFFRFYLIRQVPPEMFSDHAEKLLDVADVLRGNTRIFFPRNTGREAFQMYLTAAVSKIFGTGLSFLSLKIGTILAGFFTLPYIYLLGKEYANRRVGLFAVFLAGVAYWPNVISRVALRFTLYPFFAAPAFYYFIRGLRKGRRNDFIYSGIALGLGLHGYSPFRIVPLIVIVAAIIYALHHTSKKDLKRVVTAVLVIGLISLIVFLPLFRFTLSHYEIMTYRMRTRMASLERPLPGPTWKVFLNNTGKALVMFQWNNGETWVHSIPYRPALGIVSAALFTLGVVMVMVRYVRDRHWLDLLMLALIPAFLMTSILSLAFPAENPCLNRTGGAIIPVFIIAGVALDGLYMNIKTHWTSVWGSRFAVGLVILLLVLSAAHNKKLVFEDYYGQFLEKSWNTSDVGYVIDSFYETLGEEDHAWVVPFPHWVDTRLVGIRAGEPLKDYALWREDIPSTLDIPAPKLYIVKPEDEETIDVLRAYYPGGLERVFDSEVEGRDFLMYYVIPEGSDR